MTNTDTSPPRPQSRPATRGITDVNARVVERIAGRAAAEVDGVLPAPRAGLSRLAGAPTQPSVAAHVDGHVTRLDVRLAVAYPAPIRSVARDVQSAVRSKVEVLTGMDVASVNVEVVSAPLGGPPRRRVI